MASAPHLSNQGLVTAYLCTVLVGLAVSTRASADVPLLDLGGKFLSALKDADSAFDDLKNVQTVVKDMEAGKTPSVKENRWAQVAKKYQDAAAAVAQAPLPTAVDPSQFRVSLDQLRDCAVRPNTLKTLEAYLTELKNADARGADGIDQIKAREADADAAMEVLKYAIDVHTKLISIPVYGEIFTWDWFELNESVSKSLHLLRSKLKRWRDMIESERQKLSIAIPNLDSNIQSLRALRCSLFGLWDGNISDGKKTYGFELWLVKGNAGTDCTFRFNHNNDMAGTCIVLKLEPRTVSVQLAFNPDPQTITGTPSLDYTSITGTWILPASSTTTANNGAWSVKWLHE